MRTLPAESEMWRACLGRDSSFDGLFVLAVRTTGIFCRPTCPARKPNRANVEFFSTPRDALTAGYRPCKRCRPLEQSMDAARPEWAGRLMEFAEQRSGEKIRDRDLRALGIDPVRARRYFKEHYGMTFQAYHRARRLGASLTHLRQGGDLTGASHRHGFESQSGFRAAFERLFGNPPGRGRASDCLAVQWVETPIGPFVAGATDRGVCLFEFADRRAFEAQIASLRKKLNLGAVPAVRGMNRHLDQLAEEVGQYFDGALTQFTVALDIRGTPFQMLAWNRLRAIPYGETLSYAELAREIGRAGAQRAVGRANGQNRIAVIVPCHRVVRSDGNLCGYGGGLWRKKFLLDHERCVMTGLIGAPAQEARVAALAPG